MPWAQDNTAGVSATGRAPGLEPPSQKKGRKKQEKKQKLRRRTEAAESRAAAEQARTRLKAVGNQTTEGGVLTERFSRTSKFRQVCICLKGERAKHLAGDVVGAGV